MQNYQKLYAYNKNEDGTYGLKSYWTSSQTVEFDDGQTLEAYKTELLSDIDDKADGIGYSLDEGEVYLYSGEETIATEGMDIRTRPNVVLDDISNLSARLADDRFRFTWQDPSDVVFSELPLVEWAGTKVVRKVGSAPIDATDGTLIVNSTTRDQYVSSPLFDTNISGDTYYYYRFFPYDTEGNYYGKTCVVMFKPISLVAADIPYPEETYEYTGSTITPTFINYDTDKMTRSGANSAKNVGDYTVTFTLKDGYKWSDNTTAPKEVTWSIGKKALSVPQVSGTYTYTGSAQTPTITGYNSTFMTKGGDYSATDADTYTMTVSLSDTSNTKFEGTNDTSISLTWTIDRAEISNIPSASSLTYNGSEQSPTWTNYDSSKLQIGGDTAETNAGDYVASFVPTGNYQWSDGTIAAKNATWSISKAAGIIQLSADSVVTEFEGTQTVNVLNSSGTVTVEPTDVTKSQVSISGSVITIRGLTTGSTSCRVNVAASQNYLSTYIVVLISIKTAPTWYCSSMPFLFVNNSHMKSFVTYNNEIYALGGDCLYIWDGNFWRLESKLPSGFNFTGCNIVVYNNELHALGVKGSSNVSNGHLKYVDGEWINVDTLPLSSFVSIVCNGELYIIGGSYMFKLQDGSWVKICNTPYSIAITTGIVVYNNKIHIFGGNVSGHYKDHYMWDGTSWSSVSTLPYNYNSLGFIFVINNKMHILYGSSTPYHYYFDNEQWIQESDLPCKVGSSGNNVVMPYNGDYYIFGRINSIDNAFSLNVGKFNSAFTSCVKISKQLPETSYNAYAGVHDNKIHLLIGNTIKHYIYNESSDEFVEQSAFPLTSGTIYALLFSYNNELHCLCSKSSTAYHYKYVNSQWTKINETMPFTSTNNSAVVVYNNKVHVFNAGKNHYTWDGTSWTTESSTPIEAKEAVVYNDHIYIFESSKYSKSYSMWTGSEWTEKANVDPSGYYISNISGSTVVLNNMIYTYGGNNTHQRDFYKYNGNEWINMSPFIYDYSNYSCSSSVVYDDKIYLFGNYSGVSDGRCRTYAIFMSKD